MRKSFLWVALALACGQAAAQWSRIDGPPRQPLELITTAAVGELVSGGQHTSRGRIDTGAWERGLSPIWFSRLTASPDASHVIYGFASTLVRDRDPLWRSVDAGLTWHELKSARTEMPLRDGFTFTPSFNDLSPGPFAGGMLYAVGGFFYSSSDGGFNWRVHRDAEDPTSLCTISYAKAHPQRDRLVFAAGGCVARSTDGGRSWRTALPYSGWPGDVLRVEVSPADGTVYAYTVHGTPRPQLWESRDLGETWEKRTWTSGTWELWPDRFQPDVLWAGNATEFVRSTDRGRTWSQALPALPGAGTFALHFPGTLLFPAPGVIVGVLDMTPRSRYVWNAVDRRWDPFRLDAEAAQPVKAFAARTDGRMSLVAEYGLYSRDRDGSNWEIEPADNILFLARQPVTDELFAGYKRFRYIPGGFGGVGRPVVPAASQVMRIDESGMPQPWGPEYAGLCDLLAVAPHGPPRVLLACDGFLGFGSQAESFRGAGVETPGTPIAGAWGPDDVIFIVTDRGIYRNLKERIADLPADTTPTSLVAHPTEAGRLFLAHTHGILESRDGGRTWQGFGGDAHIPSAKLSATPDALHAATQIGVFRCANYRCEGGSGYARADLVEFETPQGGHYFLTAEPRTIAMLDAGGWKRTGERIGALRERAPGSTELRRFLGLPVGTRFFAPEGGFDASYVRQTREWVEEDTGESFIYPIDAAGSCAVGAPVWRLLNDGSAGGGLNHRYTTKASIRDAMVARGWHNEGVRFCAVQ